MTMTARRLPMLVVLFTLLLAQAGPAPLQAQGTVTSPEQFFGFKMGADRKIARWDKLIEYYRLLEKQGAAKVKVVEMGPTEMGNPFLLVIVTSAANQKNLEPLRQNTLKLSDPRGLTRGRREEGRRGEQAGGLHDHEHARHRDRRRADVARARLRPRHPAGRRDPPHPRQRGVPAGAILQPGRPDHGDRLVQQVPRHRVRGRRPAVAVPQVRRARQQPRRHDDEHEGVAVRRAAAVHRVEAAGLLRLPPHGELRGAHLLPAVRRADPAPRRPARVDARRRGTAARWPARRRRPACRG